MTSDPRWLVVGDTHGQDEIIEIDQWCARNNIRTVIQVGDFGIHWPGGPCRIYKYFYKRQRQKRATVDWYTCGGNHDNYTRLQLLRDRGMTMGPLVIYAQGVYHVERGNVIFLDGHPVMFLGGAVSSDCTPQINLMGWGGKYSFPGRALHPQPWKQERKMTPPWDHAPGAAWADEAPTLQECQYAVEQADKYKPGIWITHDIRSSAAPYFRGGETNPLTNLLTNDTSTKLEGVFKAADTKPRTWFHGHYHRHYEQELEGTKIVGCGIAHEYRLPAKSGWLFNPNTHELEAWDEV
jgi:hypothetical protein